MTPSAAFDLHVSLRYKARDRYPIDPTEPTMVFDVNNLRYNYSKWRRFGTTSTKSRDFSWLHPEHVTGIPSTQWNPHNPTLGLRSPSSNAMLSSIVEYNLSCSCNVYFCLLTDISTPICLLFVCQLFSYGSSPPPPPYIPTYPPTPPLALTLTLTQPKP